MTLNIIYRDIVIGTLSTTADRGIVFAYTPNAQKPISISMGELGKEYPQKQCLPSSTGCSRKESFAER